MHPDNRNRTCYTIVTRGGDGVYPFCWEIQLRRKVMGVKVSGSGYRSYRAAHDAGSRALDQLLDNFSKEAETRRSRTTRHVLVQRSGAQRRGSLHLHQLNPVSKRVVDENSVVALKRLIMSDGISGFYQS